MPNKLKRAEHTPVQLDATQYRTDSIGLLENYDRIDESQRANNKLAIALGNRFD